MYKVLGRLASGPGGGTLRSRLISHTVGGAANDAGHEETLPRWRVFLSSTFWELAEYRERLLERLRGDPKLNTELVAMEEFPSSSTGAQALSLELLDSSHVVVLLLGAGLGSRVPEDAMSYTEVEYRHARAVTMPVLPFELDPNAEGLRAPAPIPAGTHPESAVWDRARQAAFRNEVVKASTLPSAGQLFKRPDELAAEVAKALRHWLELEAKPLRTAHGEPFINHGRPYQSLRRRVLQHENSVVKGPPGTGKSTLVAALEQDPDVRHSFGMPILQERVSRRLGSPLAAAEDFRNRVEIAQEDARGTVLDSIGNPGRNVLLAVHLESIWSPPSANSETRAQETREDERWLRSFVQNCLPPANGVTTVFEAVGDRPAEVVASALGLSARSAIIPVTELAEDDGIALLRVEGALTEGCATCDALGRRVVLLMGATPPLLRLAAVGVRKKAGDARDAANCESRHQVLRISEQELEELPTDDRAYETVRREIDSLSPSERRVLEAASVLPRKPFTFSTDVLDRVAFYEADERGSGDHSHSTSECAEELVGRGFLERGKERDSGLSDDQMPRFMILPLVSSYVQHSLEDSDAGPAHLREMNERAGRWYDDAINSLLEGSSYEGWYQLENGSSQSLFVGWLQLLSERAPLQAAEELIRLYFKALWWWGCRTPFKLCDLLADVGWSLKRHRSQPPPAGRAGPHVVVEALDRLHKYYPREGQFRRAHTDADRRDWHRVDRALRDLADQLSIPTEANAAWLESWDAELDESRRTKRREIAQLLHAFLAHAHRGARAEIDEDAAAAIAGHYAVATSIAREGHDDWNQAWFWYELGDTWLAVRNLRKASACARVARYHAKKIAESPENLDFEILANIDRLTGDIIWRTHSEAATQAFEHWCCAVHYALCFQLWPHEPDLYTAQLYDEQRWLAAGRLMECVGVDDGRSPRLRAAGDRIAKFFGRDPQELLTHVYEAFKGDDSRDRLAMSAAIFPVGLPIAALGKQDRLSRSEIRRFTFQARTTIRDIEAREPDLVALPAEEATDDIGQ